MSMKIFRLSSFSVAFVLAAAAFCFEVRVSADNAIGQNANSSTTMTENTNTGTTRRRRGRRHKKQAAAPAESMTDASTEPSTSAPGSNDQVDLSGTYTGNFDCSAAGVSGQTTLTVTGNNFTLSDGKSGRIVGVTTRGYTGVTMQFGELVLATSTTPGVSPTVVSMRARKKGDRLTLTPVAEEKHACSFTP